MLDCKNINQSTRFIFKLVEEKYNVDIKMHTISKKNLKLASGS